MVERDGDVSKVFTQLCKYIGVIYLLLVDWIHTFMVMFMQ